MRVAGHQNHSKKASKKRVDFRSRFVSIFNRFGEPFWTPNAPKIDEKNGPPGPPPGWHWDTTGGHQGAQESPRSSFLNILGAISWSFTKNTIIQILVCIL